MEGEGGLLECMGWSGQGSLGEIIEGVSLRQVNEMFEACAWRKLQELRVERERCSIAQKLRYWSFSRKYRFYGMEVGRNSVSAKQRSEEANGGIEM